MKKLGTPIGAGPGREREKVGLEGPGTPLPDGSDGPEFFDFPLAGLLELGVVLLEDGPGWLEDFCFLGGCFGFGVGEDDDCEVVVEEELEPEPGFLVRAGVELVVVLVEVEELDEVGAQDSLSDCTTPCTGRFSAEIGVPGGALT
jgi:hypothetical protein